MVNGKFPTLTEHCPTLLQPNLFEHCSCIRCRDFNCQGKQINKLLYSVSCFIHSSICLFRLDYKECSKCANATLFDQKKRCTHGRIASKREHMEFEIRVSLLFLGTVEKKAQLKLYEEMKRQPGKMKCELYFSLKKEITLTSERGNFGLVLMSYNRNGFTC